MAPRRPRDIRLRRERDGMFLEDNRRRLEEHQQRLDERLRQLKERDRHGLPRNATTRSLSARRRARHI